jgi:hypothetical protein
MKTPYSKRLYKHKSKSMRNNKINGGVSSERCVFDPETEQMKNSCPGLKYFNEIKDSLVKDPDAVYIVMGHGCDLEGELLTVPPKCKYITSVACGIESGRTAGDIMYQFLQNNLEQPITRDSLKKLELFKATYEKGGKRLITKNIEFRIHHAGEKFVNNKNWCFLRIRHLAGLRKLGHIVPNPPELNHDFPQKYTLRSYMLLHFEGSLFPTCAQVSNCLELKFNKSILDSYDYNWYILEDYNLTKLIADNFSIDYATLLDNLQGTFINAACRPLCKGPAPRTKEDYLGENEFVEQSRTMSGRQTYVMDIDFFKTLPKVENEYNEILLTDELRLRLEELKREK